MHWHVTEYTKLTAGSQYYACRTKVQTPPSHTCIVVYHTEIIDFVVTFSATDLFLKIICALINPSKISVQTKEQIHRHCAQNHCFTCNYTCIHTVQCILHTLLSNVLLIHTHHFNQWCCFWLAKCKQDRYRIQQTFVVINVNNKWVPENRNVHVHVHFQGNYHCPWLL